MTFDQPDLFSGEQLRDAGIARVTSNNESWIVAATRAAEAFISRQNLSFTGEDIRFYCEQAVGPPKHPNAWGALVNALLKRGAIQPTHQFRPMRDPNSHARITPVYNRL